MHSCSWERTPGVFVRTGTLQLIRDDILILKLQTNRNGKLHGEYSAWDDDGVLTANGHYRDGQKEGEWQSIDKKGTVRMVLFRDGVPITP
jgi:antitoxin component YwqK of YwqJK toxin-antitoxin module